MKMLKQTCVNVKKNSLWIFQHLLIGETIRHHAVCYLAQSPNLLSVKDSNHVMHRGLTGTPVRHYEAQQFVGRRDSGHPECAIRRTRYSIRVGRHLVQKHFCLPSLCRKCGNRQSKILSSILRTVKSLFQIILIDLYWE